MNKKLGIAVAASILVLLSACGGTGPTTKTNAKVETGGKIPTATSASLLKDAKKEGSVTWYTSSTQERTAAVKDLWAKTYPDITLNVFQAGGSQVLAKVEAEAASGGIQADVFDYSDGPAIIDQANRGLLARYAPEGSDKVPDDIKDKNGYWISPGTVTATFAYNNQIIDKKDAPTSWKDLADPKWKGKIGMGSPTVAGTAIQIIQGWNEALGDDYLQKLGPNLQVLSAFGDTENAILSGSAPIGVVLSFRAYNDVADGKPITVVNPKEGQILTLLTMGINAKAPHPKAARLFENFILSVPNQKITSSFYQFPARSDVETATKDMPALSEMKLIEPDRKALADAKVAADIKTKFQTATS